MAHTFIRFPADTVQQAAEPIDQLDRRTPQSVVPYYRTNAFGTGRSPAMPYCWISTPAVERLANDVEFDGLTTVASTFPSPS